MLTLTRSVGESIRIGDDIEVVVIEVRGGTVRLGFKAPRSIAIHREEVYQQIVEVQALASAVAFDVAGALSAFVPRASAEELVPSGPRTAVDTGHDVSRGTSETTDARVTS
ncbi:carbon storage regulator CsrA [Modestobacter sp. I12A-02628]|uniref:Translational regulator CsrA n=1 Tax=Goekera deserti TaxID=2497753 RepID=A0A7K3WCK8_9ACTN|nr:carbon storage regulator CsrA [Goekera deserti]MPQ99517.1 carbon storage regulator CsrA [Goekera deserti]NDI49004.1 carbon storage regulator CsrA [Goekera deserti]NEL54205.1 carbon storage regulator CsrA [Goekera deserti]